jgi:hypothetical protein
VQATLPQKNTEDMKALEYQLGTAMTEAIYSQTSTIKLLASNMVTLATRLAHMEDTSSKTPSPQPQERPMDQHTVQHMTDAIATNIITQMMPKLGNMGNRINALRADIKDNRTHNNCLNITTVDIATQISAQILPNFGKLGNQISTLRDEVSRL